MKTTTMKLVSGVFLIAAMMTSISNSFGWSSGGPYGGYIYKLATVASNNNILYAGTDYGLYKSSDAGKSWEPTKLNRQRVNAVAVNPQDDRMIFVGTDEGIKKSTDGGTTWSSIGPFDSTTGQAHRIRDVAISSQTPLTVYTVTWIGPSLGNHSTKFHLFKSIDGGNIWQNKFTHEKGDGIKSILIDSIDSNRLYLAVGKWNTALYLSSDGGDTWTAKRFPTPFISFQEPVALAMTPADISPVRIYGVIGGDGVYTSLDRGETWTATSKEVHIDMNGPYALVVDPVDPDTVYVSTRYYNRDIRRWDGFLHKSINAGASWETYKLPGLATDFVWGFARQLYAGFDNGVQKSSDQGATWHKSDRGIALTPIAGLAVDLTSNKILAVINYSEDEKVLSLFNKYSSYHMAASTDEGLTWNYLENGPKNLSAVTIVPGAPSTIWAGDGFRDAWSSYVYKSNDAGNSWTSIRFYETSPGTSTIGASDILVHDRNPQCVIVGFQHITGYGILARSTDGGNTWSELGQSTSALASDPNYPDIVYRGRSMAGGFWEISDVCGNWRSTMIATHTDIGSVFDIGVGSDSTVYLAASDGLWRWDRSKLKKLVGPPQGIPTALAIDNDNVDTLYVGTFEHGIYSSDNGGLTWISLNNGLGSLSINKLAITKSERNKTLYAGTKTGVWRKKIESSPSPPSAAIPISPSGTVATNTPTYTWNAVSGATWYYLWVDGPSGNAIKQWYSAAQAGCTAGAGNCAVTPAQALATGRHTWWIQTWNTGGFGPWSRGLTFSAQTRPTYLIGSWPQAGTYVYDLATNRWYQMTTYALLLAAGDINGDGLDDLIGVWASGLWVRYSTARQWARLSTIPPSNIAVADMTGNQRKDIIGSWSVGLWYRNSVTGAWVRVTSAAKLIACGDITGDGRDDLVGTWDSGLWLRDGQTGTWVLITQNSPSALAIGDMTGNNRSDIIGSWSTGVYYRNSITQKWQTITANPAQLLAAGDLNGNGREDLIGVWPSGLWIYHVIDKKWQRLSTSRPNTISTGKVLALSGDTLIDPLLAGEDFIDLSEDELVE